ARSIKLGLDLKGGIYAVYEMDESESMSNLSSRMEGTRTRLENLLYSRDYPEATVVREGNTRLRVEVPDVADPGNIFEIIGKPASLRFVLKETGQVVLTGSNVVKAEAMYQNGQAVVALSLDSAGTEAFATATANNIGKEMSIISTVDGEDTTISSPTINVAITNGQAIIEGMGDYEAAKRLADQITAGQFEVKLSLLECSTVSPTLGEKALKYGLIAGIVGLLLVMAFLIWRYRLLGAVASLALLMYTSLMLLFLAILPWVQLTLPGIAGIILSIGMAVDANVIIYERIKDEFRKGKSMMAATHAGFKKATMAIIDSNVTTIIAAVVLLIFGTGSIRGFALTLLVGILLSLFTAMLVTRAIVKWTMAIFADKPSWFSLKRDETNGNGETQTPVYEEEKEEAPVTDESGAASGEVANETV
ncbi:MAG: protein translocase subunit SecD, partial [Clostridiales bacterium]|nr:protein translocase subunit SecD [Clostridiales bacterium]